MDLQQEMSNETLETILVGSSKRRNYKNDMKMEEQKKKGMVKGEGGQKCPRCDSLNTKFCYYNNYSLSQPRYFCKSCRRYWTKGGTLRNVPVGGSCRRNKRSSSFSNNNNTHKPPLLATSSFPYHLSFATSPAPSFPFGGGIFEGQNGHFNNGSILSLEGSSSLAVENYSKQEMNGDKTLYGFPWQMIGDSSGIGPEIDTGRERWNGLGPSWGGLLNTSLV